MSRIFVLYDGRACCGVGTDDASVCEVCDTEEEARESSSDYGGMTACYSYEDEDGTLTDERWEFDYIA